MWEILVVRGGGRARKWLFDKLSTGGGICKQIQGQLDLANIADYSSVSWIYRDVVK